MNIFGNGVVDLSDKPTPQAIGKLAPYRALAGNALQKLASDACFVALKAGRLTGEWAGADALYLNSGQLEVTDAEGHRISLSSVSPSARYPLPSGSGYRMRVIHPVTFLKVPTTDHTLAAWPLNQTTAPPPIDLSDEERGILRTLKQHLAEGRYRLPSMPNLAIKLSRSINRSEVTTRDIVKLIQLDPALATKLMRVANSAAFHFGKQARNVHQAVTRLGRLRVQNLAVGFLLREAFQTRSAALQKRAKSLWIDSCHVAAVSFMLAKHIPSLDPERAMLAGLIHRIGALPALSFANQFEPLKNNPALLDHTIKVFSRPLGEKIIRKWDLGEDLVDVVRNANAWGRVGYALPDYVDVVLLAQLHTLIGTPDMETLPRVDQLPAYQKLDFGRLTPRRSISVLELADQDIQELKQILSQAG